MIPKIFHFVWVGDPTLEPKDLIQSWSQNNPEFEVKIYRNDDLFNKEWVFKELMLKFYKQKQYCGVADLIRWEVLLKEGGIALDADSLSLQPLPEWLLQPDFITSWGREGGFLSNGFVGCTPQHIVIKELLENFQKQPPKTERWSWSKLKKIPIRAWKSVGPQPFTELLIHSKKHWVTILPSHFFLPERSHGKKYEGGGPVYAYQFWGSTTGACLNDKENIEKIKKYYLNKP